MYTAASAVPSGTCSEVYGAKIAGLRSLQPCRAHQCRTLVPRRRCTASQSGAQQLDSARRHVSSEEAQKGLQYQLDRSVRPAVTQQEPGGSPQEYEQDLRRRRCSAREWITPWLVRYRSVCRIVAAPAVSQVVDHCCRLARPSQGPWTQWQRCVVRRQPICLPSNRTQF